MAKQGYFYHVAFQLRTATNTVYGDMSIIMRTRIDSDASLREVRAAIADKEPGHLGDVVLTGITLLARVDLPQTLGDAT